MKVLVIGLGSMGKRRVRNLQAIGEIAIDGVDMRADRRQEAEDHYQINTYSELPLLNNYDAVIISTPPDYHLPYIQQCLDEKVSCFIEASVIQQGLPELLHHPNFEEIVIAPSCTFRFHPSIKQIKQLVTSGEHGKVTGFSYHMGQYLPDWHPWEDISEFYVGKKETGAGREMVPFELTWIVDILGFPQTIKGYPLKTGLLNVDIDDIYAIALAYSSFGGTLMVDVVSRFATRALILNLEQAQIRWSWENQYVWVYDAIQQREIVYHNPKGNAQTGYNVNIVEEMYIEELHTFIKAVKGKITYPNTLEDDIKILQLLLDVERL